MPRLVVGGDTVWALGRVSRRLGVVLAIMVVGADAATTKLALAKGLHVKSRSHDKSFGSLECDENWFVFVFGKLCCLFCENVCCRRFVVVKGQDSNRSPSREVPWLRMKGVRVLRIRISLARSIAELTPTSARKSMLVCGLTGKQARFDVGYDRDCPRRFFDAHA